MAIVKSSRNPSHEGLNITKRTHVARMQRYAASLRSAISLSSCPWFGVRVCARARDYFRNGIRNQKCEGARAQSTWVDTLNSGAAHRSLSAPTNDRHQMQSK